MLRLYGPHLQAPDHQVENSSIQTPNPQISPTLQPFHRRNPIARMFSFIRNLLTRLFSTPRQPTNLPSLPTELRLPIYEQLFDAQCITLTPETAFNPIRVHPLLQINQRLRNEALSTFFSSKELVIPTFLRITPEERLPTLLSKLLPGQLGQISRVTIPWNQRFQVVIQFTPNPTAKVQQEDALADDVDFDDPIGIATGENFYVHVRSCSSVVDKEFCEKFAHVLSQAITCLLESEGREKGMYLSPQDMCWLVAQVNRHAEQMLRDICGISRLSLLQENPRH